MSFFTQWGNMLTEKTGSKNGKRLYEVICRKQLQLLPFSLHSGQNEWEIHCKESVLFFAFSLSGKGECNATVKCKKHAIEQEPLCVTLIYDEYVLIFPKGPKFNPVLDALTRSFQDRLHVVRMKYG